MRLAFDSSFVHSWRWKNRGNLIPSLEKLTTNGKKNQIND